jgi:ligand-binding sensor domain-containing protein
MISEPVFRSRIRGLFLLIILTGIYPVYGQKTVQMKAAQPHFRRFSVEHGLPSSETYFVHQDKKGYIWFCTDRGVVRYDGYRMTVFTVKDGLTDNVAFHIYEDHLGRLWFTTNKPGLCYFENGRFHAYKYNHIIMRELGGYHTSEKDLYINPHNGDITYSIYNTLAIRITPKGNYTIPAPLHKPKTLIWEADNRAHFMTVVPPHLRSGDLSWKEKVAPLQFSCNGRTKTLSHLVISHTVKVVKHKDAVFVATFRSLYMIRNWKIKVVLRDVPIIGLFSDGDNIWIGMYEKGVRKYRLDENKNEIDYKGRLFENYSVSCVMKDSEGGYWFSTLEEESNMYLISGSAH